MDQSAIKDIIEKIKKYNKKADEKLIGEAFEFSSKIHEGQKRLSGEEFIVHPIAVANILAELEQDIPTIIAGLLHDTIEDGNVKREDLKNKFSNEVAILIDGVTKLGRLVFRSREERQAENFRKMFLAMGEDIRIVVIKLADRLHNMRTLEFLPPAKQKETATETREIFAPLAHRLGMWRLKWELEDLAFRYLDLEAFNEIKEKIMESRSGREIYLNEFIEKVKTVLSSVELKSEIYGRPKHFYSIYKKMVGQNLEFDDVYDLLAFRIIMHSLKDCYAALGVIHSNWKPIPGRFRDYIAMPKSNGYQSLHTTVIGPQGKPVEIQIRTEEMHRIAEYGVAAHWKYKEKVTDEKFDIKMSWLRQLLDWQKDLADAQDFMESLKVDLFEEEVFVFSPKGAVIDLPNNATPIDFAYRIHTEVGHRCIGVKVNGRIVPLDNELKNGDIVEVLTGKNNNPSLDWLNYVKTTAAKNKIKNWFRHQKKEKNIELGQKIILAETKKLSLPTGEVLTPKYINQLLKDFKYKTLEDFHAAIGTGEVSAFQAAKRMSAIWRKKQGISIDKNEEKIAPKSTPLKKKKVSKQGVSVMGLSNVLVRFSKCCRPLPGDEIIGFVTKGRGVTIHRTDCPSLSLNQRNENKYINVEWNEGIEIFYPVEIEVEAFDRVGIFKDILAQVSETKTNVSAAKVQTKRGSLAFVKLILDIKNINHLNQVIRAIRKISDVYDVYRTDILNSKKPR